MITILNVQIDLIINSSRRGKNFSFFALCFKNLNLEIDNILYIRQLDLRLCVVDFMNVSAAFSFILFDFENGKKKYLENGTMGNIWIL